MTFHSVRDEMSTGVRGWWKHWRVHGRVFHSLGILCEPYGGEMTPAELSDDDISAV